MPSRKRYRTPTARSPIPVSSSAPRTRTNGCQSRLSSTSCTRPILKSASVESRRSVVVLARRSFESSTPDSNWTAPRGTSLALSVTSGRSGLISWACVVGALPITSRSAVTNATALTGCDRHRARGGHRVDATAAPLTSPPSRMSRDRPPAVGGVRRRVRPPTPKGEAALMTLVGCDLHSRKQQVAVLDTTTGEILEQELVHDGDAVERFYRALRPPVTIGIETTGYTQWFHTAMHRLGHTVLVGEAAKIRAMVVRKTKTDRRDARHLLDLLRHDRFPTVWIPDPDTRDLRALVAHRVRLVRMRTMVKNGLQAIALNHRLALRS